MDVGVARGSFVTLGSDRRVPFLVHTELDVASSTGISNILSGLGQPGGNPIEVSGSIHHAHHAEVAKFKEILCLTLIHMLLDVRFHDSIGN